MYNVIVYIIILEILPARVYLAPNNNNKQCGAFYLISLLCGRSSPLSAPYRIVVIEGLFMANYLQNATCINYKSINKYKFRYMGL